MSQLKLHQERPVNFLLLIIFCMVFCFSFFFHLRLSLIWKSVLINDFDISTFSLSGIITTSFWSSVLGFLILIVSGFLHSSNSSSSIKKSSVFGILCSRIFEIFSWGVVSKIGSVLTFLKTVSLSCCCTWGGKNAVCCVYKNLVISI